MIMFEWYVLNYDFNKKEIVQFNIFNNWILDDEVQKQVRKYLRCPSKFKFERYNEEPIYGFYGLCEEIRRLIMWQEWGRVEYEISVGKPFIEEFIDLKNKVDREEISKDEIYEYLSSKCEKNEKLEKWDCYKQCEKNIAAITRECIYQYKTRKK